MELGFKFESLEAAARALLQAAAALGGNRGLRGPPRRHGEGPGLRRWARPVEQQRAGVEIGAPSFPGQHAASESGGATISRGPGIPRCRREDEAGLAGAPARVGRGVRGGRGGGPEGGRGLRGRDEAEAAGAWGGRFEHCSGCDRGGCGSSCSCSCSCSCKGKSQVCCGRPYGHFWWQPRPAQTSSLRPRRGRRLRRAITVTCDSSCCSRLSSPLHCQLD